MSAAALRGKVAVTLFATAGSPVRRVHQPLASSSLMPPHVHFCDTHVVVSEQPPLKKLMVLKVESE